MLKKPPTDDQLKEAIQDLLKDANLEEVTMKQITRQVCYFEAFIGNKMAFSWKRPGKVMEFLNYNFQACKRFGKI